MVISSDFRIGNHRDDDHEDDAPFFTIMVGLFFEIMFTASSKMRKLQNNLFELVRAPTSWSPLRQTIWTVRFLIGTRRTVRSARVTILNQSFLELWSLLDLNHRKKRKRCHFHASFVIERKSSIDFIKSYPSRFSINKVPFKAVPSILSHAEIGQNDHQDYEPCFSKLTQKIENKKTSKFTLPMTHNCWTLFKVRKIRGSIWSSSETMQEKIRLEQMGRQNMIPRKFRLSKTDYS